MIRIVNSQESFERTMKRNWTLVIIIFIVFTALGVSQNAFKTIEITETDLNNNVNRKLIVISDDRNVIDYVQEADFPESLQNRLFDNLQKNYQPDERFSYSEYQDGTEYKFSITNEGEGPERIVSQQRVERMEKRTIDPLNGEEKVEVVTEKEHAYLGLFVQPFYYANTSNMKDVRGVKISEVIDGEAAFNAGLKKGDVLISMNNIKTPSLSLFVDAIKQLDPRSEVSFQINRDGNYELLTSIAGVRRNNEWDKVEKFLTDNPEKARLGIHIKGVENGAQIESVEPKSAADLAGLQKGDIIIEVNNNTIDDVDRLAELIGEKQIGDVLEIKYLRKEKEILTDATLQSPEELFFENEESEN